MKFISIGNKDKLRIDITYISNINSFVIAKQRLWVENKYIGDFQEKSPFGPLICTFRNLRLKRSQKILDEKISKNKIRYFYLGKPFQPGDSFAEFDIKFLKTKKNIHFIWRLNKYSTSDYINYIKKDLHHGQVSISYFEDILSQFEIIFKGQLNNSIESKEYSNEEIIQNPTYKYWDYFENTVKLLSQFDQRKVAFEFAQLARQKYDKLGLDALEILKLLTTKKRVSQKRRKDLIKNLQLKLPEREKVHPNSVLIHLLGDHTASYPIWYLTAISGTILCDLKVTTLPKLLIFTKNILDSMQSESKN